jgi:hypothetical protein
VIGVVREEDGFADQPFVTNTRKILRLPRL